MSERYGATADDWLHWDLLGYGEDLLPVVCQPGLPLSPTSKLVAYGKVPSRFDGRGQVVGFPKWTQYHATDDDLVKWSADDRLGICLQTRCLRALDVDIEDFDAAQTVREYLDEWAAGKGIQFSYRVRDNSAKFLTLFRLEGNYAKQVLTTQQGRVELLLNGQQALVAGSHPSGVHYTWEGGLDSMLIPTFSEKLFVYLKNMLEYRLLGETDKWTEGRVRKDRDASAITQVDDPVVTYLKTHGWVRKN